MIGCMSTEWCVMIGCVCVDRMVCYDRVCVDRMVSPPTVLLLLLKKRSSIKGQQGGRRGAEVTAEGGLRKGPVGVFHGSPPTLDGGFGGVGFGGRGRKRVFFGPFFVVVGCLDREGKTRRTGGGGGC